MQGDSLSVPLTYETADFKVVKTYTFKKGSYEIQVNNQVTNKTNGDLNPKIYYQFLHDGTSNQGSVMMPTFTGAAYYTKDQNFNKLGFSDIKDETFSLTSNDGWISIIERYFASAIILPDSVARKFYANKVADNIYSAGVISQLGNISPGQSKEFSVNIFSGPQLKDDLISAAKGLEYVVDYGWLTFIASPLFSVMSGIHSMVGNWGIAIILLTLLIKLLFYPLSASSYRSMAQMRELAPRLQSMKEKFGEDKQKMQQAMMELYRTEKINPLGGCLPILIQIPVFIALYWVLLGAVELRQAPFFGWIEDLSIKDPYYVLPILMAASMFLQTKLNPKPTDPMQARLMIMMPIIFSVFFFFFPAGLVLYWLANNILSIAQQWYVNKKIHAEALKKKGNG
jgi:YidC/Oxa1 family membrane protein insertase